MNRLDSLMFALFMVSCLKDREEKQMVQKQSNPLTTQEMAFLSLLTAACVVGRLSFQFIPNVQPMTALFIMITLHFGLSRGLIVSVLSLLITNFYLGMGVWTISQLIAFSILLIIASLLGKWSTFHKYLWLQGAYSLFTGYLYGFILAIIDTQVYGLTNFWVYYLAGLPFDTLHGAGNLVFYIILSPIFQRLFKNKNALEQ